MRILSSFMRNKRGNVALIFAIVLPLIIMIGVGAVNFSQRNTVKAKLQEAADAAALAGMSLLDGTPDSEREAAARLYFRDNIPNNFLASVFDHDNDVQITATNDRVTVTATAQIKSGFSWLGGPESYPANVTSVAIPNTKLIPAAVDVIAGLDGGCGNEKYGKFSGLNNAVKGMLQGIAAVQDQQVYAAGIWSGRDPQGECEKGPCTNLAYDAGTLTSDLGYVSGKVSSHPPERAKNGTNMAAVANEINQSANNYFYDARDPKIIAQKKRIAVIFQGAHNNREDNIDQQTYNICASMRNWYDAVYVIAVAGGQNDNGDCTNRDAPNYGYFPSNPLPATVTCNKPFNDPDNRDFPPIQGYQSVPVSSPWNATVPLGDAIAKIKTRIRFGARLEQ